MSQKQEILLSKQLEVFQLVRSPSLVVINIQSNKQIHQIQGPCEPPFQNLCTYIIYTKEVKHTKLGYSYLDVLRLTISS